MEVGRHSAIGAGELYLETDDPLIAQNMHTTIMKWVKRRLDATAQNKQNPTAVPPFDFIIDFFLLTTYDFSIAALCQRYAVVTNWDQSQETVRRRPTRHRNRRQYCNAVKPMSEISHWIFHRLVVSALTNYPI